MSDAKTPSDLSMDEILTAIRRIIADDEQSSTGPAGARPAAGGAGAGETAAAAPAEAAPSRGAAAEDDVLELTEALNDDGTVRRLAPIGGSAEAGGSREPPPLSVHGEAAGAAPANAEPEPPRSEPNGPLPTAVDTAPDRLVSEVTSLAAAAALARLAGAPRPPREAPLVDGQPLDEVVRELLRPLLQTWLDENLPQLVERLVEAEISRLRRAASG